MRVEASPRPEDEVAYWDNLADPDLEFTECDHCRRLPGCQVPCGGCVANRETIRLLREAREVLEARLRVLAGICCGVILSVALAVVGAALAYGSMP